MTTINVSFSDAETPDRTPVRAGKYPVIVQSVEVKQSDSGEYPYLNFELEITDGEHEGRKLWLIRSLSPKALGFLQELFTSFGIEDEDVELEVDDETNMLISPDFTGEAGTATVVNKLYEGKPQSKVTLLIGEAETEQPKKKKSSNGKAAKATAKTKVKSKAEPEEEDEDEEDGEDEEEEEGTKKPATVKAKKVNPFARGGKAKAGVASKKRFR